MRYYAVKDRLVGKFMSIQPMENDDVAIRALTIVANDPNAFKENRNDVELWYIADMDISTGLISENVPYKIGNLTDYEKKGE